jgi:hypothetical protein
MEGHIRWFRRGPDTRSSLSLALALCVCFQVTRTAQVLEEVMVGPIPIGLSKFVLQADSPDSSRIPQSDLIGVTVVLITCSYREREFVRIGYYVNNEYVCTSARRAPHLVNSEMWWCRYFPTVSHPSAWKDGPQPATEEELQAIVASGSALDINKIRRNIMRCARPRMHRGNWRGDDHCACV